LVKCNLVAHVVQNGCIMGYLYDPVANTFIPDDESVRLSDAALHALAATHGQEVTYTAATPRVGTAAGIQPLPHEKNSQAGDCEPATVNVNSHAKLPGHQCRRGSL
jgi:hypothetical protein